MQSDPLLLPLVLNNHVQESLIEQACSRTLPTRLLSWGLGNETEDVHAAGAAMGCEDGSVYLFSIDMVKRGMNQTLPNNIPSGKYMAAHSTLASYVSREPSPSPSSPKSPTHSRRSSNTIHAPHLLYQPTRSRITSSVSKTSVEAPKNHVDYDDEKEKLEGLLRGGPAVRDKLVIDGLRASCGVPGLGNSSGMDVNGGYHGRNSRLSYTGSTPSTSGTPRGSLSAPPSPSSTSLVPFPTHTPSPPESGYSSQVGGAPYLTPKFHIFPPRFGAGNCVVSLRYLPNGIVLSLQESGMISVLSTHSGLCLSSIDIELSPHFHPPPPPSPSVFLDTTANQSIWAWKYLHVVETSEGTILLALASDQASGINEGDLESCTRVAVLQLQKLNLFSDSLDSGATTRSNVLQKVAEWIMDGIPEAVGLLEEDGMFSAKLFYVTPAPASRLVTHSLHVVPAAFVVAASVSLKPSPDAISSTTVTPLAAHASLPNLLLPIPNPFKPKIQNHQLDKSSEAATTIVPGRVILGPAVMLGQIPILQGEKGEKGMYLWAMDDDRMWGALWNHNNFLIFETRTIETETRILGKVSHNGLITVEKVGADTFMLAEKRQVDTFRLSSTQETSTPSVVDSHRLEHVSSTLFTSPFLVVTAISPSLLLCTETKSHSTVFNHLKLTYTPVIPFISKTRQGNRRRDGKPRTAWSSSIQPHSGREESARRLTSLLPIDVDSIVLGFSDGSVGRSSLTNLLNATWPVSDEKITRANGMITSLHPIKNERTGEKLVIGGVDDGAITVWNLSKLRPLAQWTVFTTSLLTVIPLEEENVGRLRGCILCVSEDGTIAVIAVDGLEFLYLIPGSAAHLTRICLGEDNLLLVYADGKARLWDVKTQEFWRSMTSKTAGELLRQGGWFEAEVGHGKADFRGTPLASLQRSFSSYDAASTILLDICALSDLIHPIPASHLFRDPRLPEDVRTRTRDAFSSEALPPSKGVPRCLKCLQSLVGSLVSFGIDGSTDEICREKLAITPTTAIVGLSNTEASASLLNPVTPLEVWQISPEHTASRLLALITILRGLLAYDEECEQYANQVITFYCTSLRDAVGVSWQAPSLTFLARYWFYPSTDLRLAARALFGATVDRLSNEDIIRLVEYWQHELPCLQPDAEKQSTYSALALLIAGTVAAERYTMLSASTLTDIAKSITLYLHDEASSHRILAIDLCSRGFHIWQHYVDAMEVLRALFNLATSAEKDRNAGPQARLAVLQIASSNTPLFMTTLSLDILHPRSVQQRKSIMQLVAFLIRKKPLVLYPNLPRLVESVVKSLDPGSSGDRDAVFDAATEILGQVVKTFPTVDFHMPSQRLCVGTSEGAVVMYDLKTSTRLYVLESHKKHLAGCSFSPDGRRLVTVSLEESLVTVWKVGSSLTSLFMPGAPPRQGHSGSEPFKTLNFNVGDEANMTVAATLEWVQFEWPTDRTARLKIRDSAFTFNT